MNTIVMTAAILWLGDANAAPGDNIQNTMVLEVERGADPRVAVATVRDAAPLSTVYLLRGDAAFGNGTCSPQLAGECIDIDLADVVGRAQANAMGEATIVVTVPSSVATDAETVL